jgi:hypothetical protein
LVVTASKAVRREDGELLAVTGIDTTFDYITKALMNSDKNNASWNIARYILDADGKVLVSSLVNSASDDSGEPVLEFPPFPYIEMYQHLKLKDSGQFDVLENGRTLLVVYAPIETMGWRFVEVVDQTKYFAAKSSSDKLRSGTSGE